MSFTTDLDEVLNSFDEWKEKELEKIDEQTDYFKTVYAAIPGPGRMMDKIINKATEKLNKTIGDL